MAYDFRHSPVVDQVGIEERVARFNTRSIKKGSKVQALKLALNMIDLTTLEGKDTEGKVKQMCYKAMHPHDALPSLPTTAAVCVYPTMVKTAKDALKGSNVKVASVSTAFPSGNSTMQIKLLDTKFALDNGADEIDMVISRGEFLKGNYNFVFDEIAAIKDLCKKYDARLKVIFETGEISTLDNVRRDKRKEVKIYLNKLIQDLLGVFMLSLEEKRNIKVIREIQEIEPIRGFIIDWESIIINFISNAIWALEDTPSGSRLIRIRLFTKDNAVHLSFADSGCGIAKDTIDRIFDPTFTTKKDRQGRTTGTGMGLYIIDNLVKSYGGTIRAESPSDLGGAQFLIRVPYRLDNRGN